MSPGRFGEGSSFLLYPPTPPYREVLVVYRGMKTVVAVAGLVKVYHTEPSWSSSRGSSCFYGKLIGSSVF